VSDDTVDPSENSPVALYDNIQGVKLDVKTILTQRSSLK
jgi:hypothetical protein